MRFNPTIIALDAVGSLCALRDENGQFIGAGTREVCEVLLYILKSWQRKKTIAAPAQLGTHRSNLRSAFTL